jgi:hypothetical protein
MTVRKVILERISISTTPQTSIPRLGGHGSPIPSTCETGDLG